MHLAQYDLMRSSLAPRIEHDATVKVEGGTAIPFIARAVNLSVGGVCIQSETLLEPGEHVDLQMNLKDGGGPVDAQGEVVWVRDGGMALRFLEMDQTGTNRITRLVEKRRRDVTGVQPLRDVRIRLPSLPSPLRAVARDQTEHGIMLEAELPWLKLGSAVTTELGPDRVQAGVVRWVGLDVTRAGSARLRIFVDLDTVDRAETPPPPLVAEPFPNDFGRDRRRRDRHWFALGGVAVLFGFAGLCLFRPPLQPALLPSPPAIERESRKLVPQPVLSVPKEKPETPPPPPPKRGRKPARK
jgi:hypothetical protein